MFDGAVAVPRWRRSSRLEELGMRNSEKEIPDPLAQWTGAGHEHNKPDGWWVSSGCYFEGPAYSINRYGELSAAEPVTVTKATAALCIFDGRTMVIVSPHEEAEPAIWIGATCSEVEVSSSEATVESAGEASSADEVTLSGGGWILKLALVSRLHRRWEQPGFKRGWIESKVQPGQAKSLVKALSKANSVTPKEPAEAPPSDLLPVGQGYEWIREEGLGGVYRLTKRGVPTTATWPVDQELSTAEQLAALGELDWIPMEVMDQLVSRTKGGDLGKLWAPELPYGRVMPPFGILYLELECEGGEPDHPVRDYLWPSLERDGSLRLEPGETVEREWQPTAYTTESFSNERAHSPSLYAKKPPIVGHRAYLTTNRIACIGRAAADGTSVANSTWHAVHFRWEWVSEVGWLRQSNFKRSFLRKTKTPLEEKEAFIVRIGLNSRPNL